MADAWQSAWVEVLPDFKNFKSKANSQMSGILGGAGAAGGVAAGRNLRPGILGGIKGMAGPIVGAIAALGIGKLVGDAIGAGIRYGIDSVALASDLAETRTAISEVFGDASADIQAFAENANKELGQTRVEALRGAQNFGVFGKAAGLTGKPLADFSTKLLTLSGDLASFFNADPSEVIGALGAGLRGEAEPLRRFGILMDDATLRAKAMEMGIVSTTKNALQPQEKILAAQALILEQTGIAQGDFARTSDGLANQQRILAASLEDTKTKLGESLLPVFNDMAIFANETLVPALGDFIDKVGPILGEALDEAAPKIQELIDKMLPMLEGFALAAAEDGIPAFIATVEDIAEEVPIAIKAIQDFEEAAEPLADIFNNIGTVKGKEDRTREFANFMGDLGGSITGFFDTADREMDNWNADMKQWGREMSSGFAQGIRDGQSAVIGAAINMAAGAVSKVQSLLEINSPSKVFARIGASIPEGMALGVDGGKGAVDASIRSLVDIPSVSASVGVSVGASRGDRPIMMDGSLFGVLRELANGEAQIVVNDANRNSERKLRTGWQVR